MKYTWLFGEGKLNYVKQTYYNERWNTLDYYLENGKLKLNYVKQTYYNERWNTLDYLR